MLSCEEALEGIAFRVSVDGHRPTAVRLIGELDLAAAPRLHAALAGLDGPVELDCSGLEFIDASGLAALLKTRAACAAGGWKLVLVDPSPAVDRLLHLVELDTVFLIRRNGNVF